MGIKRRRKESKIGCKDCHYFKKESSQGICRRYPPVARIYGDSHPNDDFEVWTKQEFPEVMMNWWCGEFRKKLQGGSDDQENIAEFLFRNKTPHACPICGGKGFVPNGFYKDEAGSQTISISPETCQTCGGNCILWS